MSTLRLRALVIAGLAAVACALTGGTARADAPNPVLVWDNAAALTLAKSGAFQNESFIYLAYVSQAIDNAVRSAPAGASVDAAAIEAAYDTLNAYFPLPRAAGSPDLEALHTSTLAAIADGAAKTAGITAGAAAAAAEVASRTGDGRLTPIAVTSAFPLLPEGPGVWRYPPGVSSAQTPWVGNVRPFIMESADQFLPPPPPPLTSERWVKAFDEVKADGTGADPVKAATARFWTANVVLQYNRLFRDIAAGRALDTTASARLMAMVNVVAGDTAIALMHAKYTYLFWRPVSAIDPTSVHADGFGPVPGYDDGNPKTVEQPGWRPLLATPAHPEYPSAHASITGAMSEVWRLYLGTKDIGVTIYGGPAFDQQRSFATVDDLNDEVQNARIWGGLHYRFSVEAGTALGTKVARYDLQNGFGLGDG